jgi:hypothetical protein
MLNLEPFTPSGVNELHAQWGGQMLRQINLRDAILAHSDLSEPI